MTFMWGQLNMLNMQYGGPDKLKERYADPKKSTYRIKVQNGTPTDMARVELDNHRRARRRPESPRAIRPHSKS